MATAFSRTLRVIEADRGHGASLGLLSAALLLTAWTGWATLSRITLYEMSSTARLEVDRAVYSVQSPMAGRVTHAWLTAGKQVQVGEPLLELDTATEALQVREARTLLSTLTPQLEALRLQIAAEQRAADDEHRASGVAAEEARANAQQADIPAKYTAVEEERLRQLRAERLIAERDYQKARADAQQSRFAAEREQIAIRRIEQEQHTRESDRASRIQALQTEIVKLEGQEQTTRATIDRLQNEISRRIVRAPVAGLLGEAAVLRIGSVVSQGEKIGAVVPSGKLVVIAQFSPPAALGRIAPGQKAQVRLDGFPWAQFGTVPAVVSLVASEVRDGTVRVELTPDTSKPGRIPLQHGLPGTVEIAVDSVTPAALTLRTAGGLLARPNVR